MRIDGDIHRSVLAQAPSGPCHAEMVRNQRLDVGILCAKIAGVAEPAVILHVDDEGADFSPA